MTLARIILKLSKLRRWVALGVLFAGLAAFASISTSHSTVYASASTQMLVDSPDSALGNASVDLTGYIARASVFARLMTSAEALQYIGKAAGINGSLIDANGPIEVNGSPTATHAPVAVVGGKDLPAPAIYELSFVQNPSLPTVDVYAQAPTTAQAIALANGAVTGFAKFVSQLDTSGVSQGNRINVRQLGQATGGMVDPGASKKIALLAFVGVFALWCCVVLYVSRVRADLRAARQSGEDDAFAVPEKPLPTVARVAPADRLLRYTPAPEGGDAVAAEPDTNGGVSRRAWATSRVESRP